jgi:hypothetical protein
MWEYYSKTTRYRDQVWQDHFHTPHELGGDLKSTFLRHLPLTIAAFSLHLSPWHKRSVLLPLTYATLTSGNLGLVCGYFRGSFVSPMRVALYARVSIHDQHTLAMPIDAMRTEEQKAAATAAATLGTSAAGPGQRNGPGYQACGT